MIFKTFQFTTQYEHEMHENRTREAVNQMEKIARMLKDCEECEDRFYPQHSRQLKCRWCEANVVNTY